MHETTGETVSKRAGHFAKWLAALLSGAVVLGAGCTAAHHRRAADKEVYGIVQQAEWQIFGKTNQFGIDTAYSARKPKEILPSELIEDRLQTNRRSLTIEDALGLAVNNSRDYQNEKERLFLSALRLTETRHVFSPQFTSKSISGKLERQSDGQRRGTLRSDFEITKVFATGGEISLALVNDLMRWYTGDPRREAVSALSLKLSQPLLRGFGRNSGVVENLTQSERDVIYAVRNYSYFQNEFALEIVTDYFALLEQKDVIRNRYTNYLGRVRSTQRLEARKDRERSSDVDQARQAELSARNNYVNAVASFRNSLDQFKIKLGLPLGEKIYLDDSALTEVKNHGLVPAPLDTDQAYRVAVERQLQILNAIDQFEDRKRKIRVAVDALKPGLNLTGGADLGSTEPTDFTRFNAKKVRADVGLSLDLPINQMAQRNDYRGALIDFEAEIRSLTLTLDSLKDSIERGLRTLEQRRQNYEIQKSALELANRRVEGGLLRMQAGVSEVRDLVEAQDAQIAAQNAVTSAIVAHQQARLQLMLGIGALRTEDGKFWLKDHLTGFLPASTTAGRAAAPPEQSVIPPDEFFNN